MAHLHLSIDVEEDLAQGSSELSSVTMGLAIDERPDVAQMKRGLMPVGRIALPVGRGVRRRPNFGRRYTLTTLCS